MLAQRKYSFPELVTAVCSNPVLSQSVAESLCILLLSPENLSDAFERGIYLKSQSLLQKKLKEGPKITKWH